MKRSRLKNIISKSNAISNKQEVGNPFDEFKKSLPIEVDDNYRLEAAWKAYGSPKDYKTALWDGMIQPIDENTYKLPSIGYNEETDEYEYLNKGKSNETVDKDIRVWDNDVIPLVQELKLGGYVRTFNKEKDCWTYTKNSQKENTLDLKLLNTLEELSGELIDSFLKGGKPEYKKVKSDKAYYDKDSDTVYYTNDEDLVHEKFHARPDSVLLELLRPYYENLNDEKILNFGGNLLFVKRFEGDPGYFYSPEELGARISAAKFRTKGNNYTPEFFKYLRTNENLYGDNMRDLLYMYNDENLSKIFNIGNTQSFKQDGKPKLDSKESGEEPVGYLNDGTPLYKKGDGTIGPLTKENIGKDNLFDLIKSSDANWAKRLQDPNRKYITYPDGSIGNFKLAWSEDENGTIVYPEILEIDGELIDLSNDREKAWKSAIDHKDYIYFPSNDAADWFTKNYKNYYKGFDQNPLSFKEGGQMNVIPEGALHARKNNMELAKEGEITHKGIPVIDNDGVQQAEIERNEIIFSKDVTDKIEKLHKKYKEEESSSKKDDIAIEMGKFLAKEIIKNTDDKTGLILEVLNDMQILLNNT